MVEEFTEIGHCGGQFTVTVKTDEEGNRSYSIGYKISNHNPASMVGVAVNTDGEPLGIIDLGWNPDANANGPQPNPGFIQALLASDSTGSFGHECPNCNKYWRTRGFTSHWKTVCPYCGIRASSHYYLTKGHRAFLNALTDYVHEALNAPEDGEYVIDMDEIVKSVQAGEEAPTFYHTDEAQQNHFECKQCGTTHDILGRYGYCCSCAYRNNLDIIRAELDELKTRIGTNDISPIEAIKLTVSALDSGGVDYVKQLTCLVPMTEKRLKKAERIKFHDLDRFAAELDDIFDIQITKNIKDEDTLFLQRMFLRRHVYEHCGGVVDDGYLTKSGDETVRNGQEIRESRQNALRFASLVGKLAKNLDEGFSEIIPLNQDALAILRPKYK